MPKKLPVPMGPKPRRPSPEELARTAVDRLELSPSGRVHMTFRLTLPRASAEALVTESIRQDVNVGTLVEQILERAVAGVKKRTG